MRRLYRYRFAYEFLPILYEIRLSEIHVIYASCFCYRRDCDNDINTNENEVCQDETGKRRKGSRQKAVETRSRVSASEEKANGAWPGGVPRRENASLHFGLDNMDETNRNGSGFSVESAMLLENNLFSRAR